MRPYHKDYDEYAGLPELVRAESSEEEDFTESGEEESDVAVQESDEHDDGADDDLEAADLSPVRARRTRRTSIVDIDYGAERVDQTFTQYPGLSHFGRTRKGGDARPNGSEPALCKAIASNVTIHNFFVSSGKHYSRNYFILLLVIR